MSEKKKYKVLAIAFSMMLFTGCEAKQEEQTATVCIEQYVPVSYKTVEVKKGDFTPVIELRLKASAKETISHSCPVDNMEVENVFVNPGDHVKKGDTLITFKSEELEEEIKEYESRLEADSLLLDHLTNMSKLDLETDYKNDLDSVSEDMEICRLYLEELKATLDLYRIKAAGDGSIIDLYSDLGYGIVEADAPLGRVCYSENKFHAITSSDYNFEIGDVYTATSGTIEYEMKIIEIVEDKVSDDVRTIYFEPMDMNADFGANDWLNMVITLDTRKDALYIPEKCIKKTDGDTEEKFVYVLGDDGYKEACKVKTGETLEDMIVITEGLEEGQKVVME